MTAQPSEVATASPSFPSSFLMFFIAVFALLRLYDASVVAKFAGEDFLFQLDVVIKTFPCAADRRVERESFP